MIRSKTVFVIGAGASCELGFPSGAKLLSDIAKALDIQFNPLERTSGAPEIVAALQRIARAEGLPSINEYISVAQRVKAAASLARSIDNVIDQNDDEPKIEKVAKLAISLEILKSEQRSKLLPSERQIGTAMDLSRLTGTWLYEFAQVLTTDVRKSAIDAIFDNVTIICFNYDRAIEAFLPHALAANYGIRLASAEELTLRLNIIHPYGQVGRLPSTHDADNGNPYGALGTVQLENIADSLKTFSEQLDDVSGLNKIRQAMLNAHQLVFLGFGFHRQNMALLSPPSAMAPLRRVSGTIYKEPAAAKKTILGLIERAARPSPQEIWAPITPDLEDAACVDFMRNHYLPLTA